MRIVIATGIYPPEVGGPAQYAQHLKEEFENMGHRVTVRTFTVERKLPSGVRHVVFFLKLYASSIGSDCILAFDTYSVGVPAAATRFITGIPLIVRVGGDFLWEQYLERTHDPLPLPSFYREHRSLSPKERIIFLLTRWMLRQCDGIVFTTAWQRDIWMEPYRLSEGKLHIIGNFFGERRHSLSPRRKNFIAFSRNLFLKNMQVLREAFALAKRQCPNIELDVGTVSYEKLERHMEACYAVIVPSLSEVSPNYVADAIRYGKPFILTHHTGYRELLKDIGLFVDPLDIRDSAEKMVWLADEANYQSQTEKVRRFSFQHIYRDIALEFLRIIEHV